MRTEKFSGIVETAYGSPLPKPVKFSGEFEAFESYDEIVKANEIPSNDDIVSIVNAKRKATARASATNDALTKAGISKPTLEDPQVQLREMVKIFVAAGNSNEVATQKARAALGVK